MNAVLVSLALMVFYVLMLVVLLVVVWVRRIRLHEHSALQPAVNAGGLDLTPTGSFEGNS